MASWLRFIRALAQRAGKSMNDRTNLVANPEIYWRVEQATRAAVIVDADDYFTALRSAMLKAQKRILLVGWDFDARINFAHGDQE